MYFFRYFPVTNITSPTVRVSFFCTVVNCFSFVQYPVCQSRMPLMWRNELDTTVFMIEIVPKAKLQHLVSCIFYDFKPLVRIVRPVFACFEYRLCIRIIIANTWQRLIGITFQALTSLSLGCHYPNETQVVCLEPLLVMRFSDQFRCILR